MTEPKEAPSIRLESMGFETRNVVLNLGSMFYFVTGLQFFILFVYLVKRIKCKSKVAHKIRKNFSIKSMMNNLFMLYFESTLEVYLSMWLNFANEDPLITKSDKFAYGLGYALIIPSLIVIPLIVLHVICKKPEELRLEKTEIKWGLIYKDLNVRKFSGLATQIIYILRRFAFVSIMMSKNLGEERKILQILCLIYLNAFCVMYVTYVKPFYTKF